MVDTETLAEINTWVGIGVSAVGVFATAPAGAALGLKRMWGVPQQLWLKLRRKQRRVTGVMHATEGGMTASAVGTVTRRPPADGPVETRLAALQAHIANVETQLNSLTVEVHRTAGDLHRRITEVDRARESDHTSLRRSIDDSEVRSTQLDARGLPLIAWGILMAGAPAQLAGLRVVGLLFPLIGMALVAWALPGALRDFRESWRHTPTSTRSMR